MAREGTKRFVAIKIMNEMADKTMAEVVPVLFEQVGLKSLGEAKHYYKFFVENGMAPGVVDMPRTARVKKEKAPKPVKEKKAEETSAKKVKESKAVTKAEKPAKTDEEMAEIRAKNALKLKEFYAKKKAAQKEAETEKVLDYTVHEAPMTTDELYAQIVPDGYVAPKFLERAE